MFSFYTSSALVAVLSLALPATATSSYALSDYITAETFDTAFDYFNETDPTKGFVEYVSKATAQSSLLSGKTASGAIYLGTDATNKVTTARPSVRVTSKKSYGEHLAIFDVAHMPYGLAVWGALWELGSGAAWPNAGEIDLIEGVNLQQGNLATLHTANNCQMTKQPSSAMSGTMTTTDCYINSGSQPGNAGCSVTDPNAASFGSAFNAAGGGVYALEYSSSAITVWFFSRAQIPTDIASNSSSPDPSSWGVPVATFTGSCDLPAHFKNLQIVINTSICGSWAGTVWNQTDATSGKSPASIAGVATCDDYAANNPAAFEQAFWEINSIRVYEQGGSAQKANRKRGDGDLWGSYNSTEDDGFRNCEEFTPGHCKSKMDAPAQSAAPGRNFGGSCALLALAALGAVFAGM